MAKEATNLFPEGRSVEFNVTHDACQVTLEATDGESAYKIPFPPDVAKQIGHLLVSEARASRQQARGPYGRRPAGPQQEPPRTLVSDSCDTDDPSGE
jgi:hypothetical protein